MVLCRRLEVGLRLLVPRSQFDIWRVLDVRADDGALAALVDDVGDGVTQPARVDRAGTLGVALRDEADLLKRRGERLVDGLRDGLAVVLPYLDEPGCIQLRGVCNLLGDEGPVPPMVADAVDKPVSHQSITSHP